MCYLLLTIAIYAMPPPPRPIEGVRGIHPFQPPNTKRRAGCVCVCSGYLLCLGPGYYALSKGHHSVERRQGKPWVVIQAARQYGSKTASDRILRGRLPWGLGGAVYLLVRLFVRSRSFVRRCKVIDTFN